MQNFFKIIQKLQYQVMLHLILALSIIEYLGGNAPSHLSASVVNPNFGNIALPFKEEQVDL